MTTPAAPAAATPDEDFATAFGELNPADGAPKPAVAAAPAAEPAPAVVEADPTAPAPAAPAAAAPEGDPNAKHVADPAIPDPAAAPVAAAPAAPAPAPDPLAQIEALRAEIAALKTAAPAAPVPTPEPAPPLYNKDEETFLAKYREEWPDIARGEALTRRQEFVQLAQYIFSQVEARVAPIEATAASNQGHTQYSQIVSLVPDYEEVRDPTLAWIETQPAFLRDAYQKVANEGSAEDVAHLIGMFKAATNYAPKAAPSTPAPAAPAAAPATPAPAVSAAAAAAAKALKPVVSGRSEPTNAADPNDFDAAFAEFSKPQA